MRVLVDVRSSCCGALLRGQDWPAKGRPVERHYDCMRCGLPSSTAPIRSQVEATEHEALLDSMGPATA